MRVRTLRTLISVIGLAVGLLAAPFAVHAADAALVSRGASESSCYRQVGDHWECVTPGAFCPAAAHGKYGYSEAGATYQCVQDGSYWRWKPAAGSGSPDPTPTPKPTPTPTPTATAKPGKSQCSRAFLPLPDPKCQPGARNPGVTQATISTTICAAGYAAKVRPSASYLSRLKVTQITQYGYGDKNAAHYEEDHLIPLLLGGSPKSVKNLWPQPRYKAGGKTALDKNAVETRLYKAVCAGTVRLAAAQKAIAKDWRTAPAVFGL
ncbi:hypothetical protein [Microtetraspora fusca]|uniref:hypothetical protein n=1 Tax=Microtetraspora fusca TaxID=1997 RepID=UPI0008310FBE|nr:hypothetical protein [Microtetraspora fusca]